MSEDAPPGSPAGLPGAGLAGRYTKTEAGRGEIRSRALSLSRPARNLLLIIDSSRPATEWLGLVQGSDAAALQALLDAGLVAAARAGGGADAPVGPVGVPVAPLGPAAAAPPRMSLAQALEHRSYKSLHDRITAEARPRLG